MLRASLLVQLLSLAVAARGSIAPTVAQTVAGWCGVPSPSTIPLPTALDLCHNERFTSLDKSKYWSCGGTEAKGTSLSVTKVETNPGSITKCLEKSRTLWFRVTLSISALDGIALLGGKPKAKIVVTENNDEVLENTFDVCELLGTSQFSNTNLSINLPRATITVAAPVPLPDGLSYSTSATIFARITISTSDGKEWACFQASTDVG